MSELIPYEGSVTSNANTEKHTGPTPPYIALPTFMTMLDRLRSEGVPPVFDGSYFGNASGSTIALHRATFKAFGLMDENRAPTRLMFELAEADDEGRKEILARIGRTVYADCIELGENRGTSGQLADLFRSKGITGATVQKAVGFYLSFAEYVDFPLSPFFKKGRASSGNGGSSPKRTRKKAAAASPSTSPAETIGASILGFGPHREHRSVEDEQKAKYIELLMKLAAPADGGEVNADILDRIERMLNVETKSSSTALSKEGD